MLRLLLLIFHNECTYLNILQGFTYIPILNYQFYFSVSSSHTLTLHNFSFRNDPLNASKGQEIIRAVDEVVEIFPPKPVVLPVPVEPKSVPSLPVVSKTAVHPVENSRQTAQPSTSLSPALPSGLLKVKLFGKMKERNTFEPPAPSEKIEASEKNDSNHMEIGRGNKKGFSNHQM